MLWPADVHIFRRVTPASGVQDPAEQTQGPAQGGEMGSFCVFLYSLNRIGSDSEAGMTFVETRPLSALRTALRVRGFDLRLYTCTCVISRSPGQAQPGQRVAESEDSSTRNKAREGLIPPLVFLEQASLSCALRAFRCQVA